MASGKKNREERRAAGWAVLLAVVITAESVGAVPSMGPPELDVDRLAQFGVFGLLATAIARLQAPGRWRLLGAGWAAVMVSAFGGATGLRQRLTPTRSMELGDWLADALGAVMAVAVYLHGTGCRRLLERPVRRRRAADPVQPRVEISPEARLNQTA